jgi:hypothetical protein
MSERFTIAGHRGRVDGVDGDVFEFQQCVDQCSFGRLDGDDDIRVRGCLAPDFNDVGNRVWSLLENTKLNCAVGVDEVKIVFFVGPALRNYG